MPAPVFVFDSTRLRSHLFFRYLSTHSALRPIYHPFLSAGMFGPGRVAEHLKHSSTRQKELEEQKLTLAVPDTHADNAQALIKAIKTSESEGKIPLANEHWFNMMPPEMFLGLLRGDISEPEHLGRNPTYLPDELFDTLRPVILIRHPALAISSIYRSCLALTQARPGDEDFELICINKPLRLLYNYFKARGRDPIVVNTEDILWRTQDLSGELCRRLDLSSEPLSDQWEPTTKEEVARMNPLVYMITKDIHDSSGIVRPAEKPQEPSIEDAVKQWTGTYGEDIAEHLLRQVEECMPHYDYLKQFSV